MRTRVRDLLALALCLGLLAAACGGQDSSAPSAGAPAPGGGLSVAEALASDLEGPLLVKGFIVAAEGEPIRLCSSVLESDPPQCGEPSLVVEGLDRGRVETGTIVQLLGTVEDGVLTVSETALS